MILIRVLNIFWRWLGLFYLFIYDLNIDWWDDRSKKKTATIYIRFISPYTKMPRSIKRKSGFPIIVKSKREENQGSQSLWRWIISKTLRFVFFYNFFSSFWYRYLFCRSRAHSLWYGSFFFEALFCTLTFGLGYESAMAYITKLSLYLIFTLGNIYMFIFRSGLFHLMIRLTC